MFPIDFFYYSTYNFSEEKVNLPFYSILEIFYINGIYGVHVFYTISGFVFAYVYLSSNKKIGGKFWNLSQGGSSIQTDYRLLLGWKDDLKIKNIFHFTDL